MTTPNEGFPGTTTKLQDDLELLGADRRAVARTLRKYGIRGRRGGIGDCPVANWLTARGHVDPCVGTVNISTRGYQKRLLPEAVETPSAVRDFIARFDSDRIARDLVTK